MRRATTSKLSRWGLLVTTLALGGLLVGTGVMAYVGALEASEDVIHARSVDLLGAAFRQVRAAGGPEAASFDDLLAEMADQGLTYVAVVDRRAGRVLASAGEPVGPVLPTVAAARGEEPTVERRGDRVRAVAVAGRGGPPTWGKVGRWLKRRLGLGLDKGGGRGAGGWPGGGGLGPGAGRGAPGAPAFALVIEFEPIVAEAITARALTTLVSSVAAAALLLIAAGVFFRMSRRADAMEAQLARDGQLKALGEMSAVLGHEIRNPLASLKGHAQLLVERLSPDGAGLKGAEVIVREAVRLETITNQILDFVKTGSLDRSEADPVEVARAAIETSGVDGVELRGEQDISAWSLDRVRMERVLVNLLANARAASPEGRPVDLTVTTEGPSTLVYAVRDRGQGLAPGDEAWIFEPFRTGRVKGTGLGLAVARRIAEAHGGGIDASNHPEGGALFRVWIPRR